MNFTSDVVIGLEIHVELDTETKLFCSCSRKEQESEEPNTRTCPTCMGMPGSKPVLNRHAIEYAIKLALSLGCELAPSIIMSRKTYFYPDNAKNYQISQHETPIGKNGKMPCGDFDVGITRVHLEEDPASLIHPGSLTRSTHVLVDYNRSGNPLCEVVTEPDMTSPEQARAFMKQLRSVLHYLGVSDPRTCIVKADANVSIKESGYTRAEIKNITGFKEIERALFYEVARQKQAFEENEKLVLETRGWDAKAEKTFRLRVKETEEDYGYIVDPDLTSIIITDKWRTSLQKEIPELAYEKAERLVKTFGIRHEDAAIIASKKSLADLFESAAKGVDPALAVNWLRHELNKVLNAAGKTFDDVEMNDQHMVELLELIENKKITDHTAREILEKLIDKPFSPKEYVAKHDLGSMSDQGQLTALAKEAIKENPCAVADFKAGEERSINFLVGKVMAATKGKAAAFEVRKILLTLIK